MKAMLGVAAAVGLSLLMAATNAAASDQARALLAESEARHRSSSLQYAGELTVVSKEGKTRSKAWRSFRQGFAGDAKVLVRFTAPPEVRGVGFLSLAREGRNADQWLYLPSMKRERRISAQDRDASFVGTDFSYEDMEEFDHSRYEVRLVGEAVEGGQPCHVIEARPKEEGGRSTYALRVLYLRKDILYLVREDYFRTAKEAPAKRLLLSDLVQQDGRWLARKLEMTDLAKGSRTTVLLKDATFDKPQPSDRFTLQNLNREGGD